MLTLTAHTTDSLHIHRAGKEFLQIRFTDHFVVTDHQGQVTHFRHDCINEIFDFFEGKIQLVPRTLLGNQGKIGIGMSDQLWSVTRTKLVSQGYVASKSEFFVGLTYAEAADWQDELKKNFRDQYGARTGGELYDEIVPKVVIDSQKGDVCVNRNILIRDMMITDPVVLHPALFGRRPAGVTN